MKIRINQKERETKRVEVTYPQLIRMAGLPAGRHYHAQYFKGAVPWPEGRLLPNQKVDLVNGMIFTIEKI